MRRSVTTVDYCELILKTIELLHDENKSVPWEWAHTDALTDAEHLSNFKETLEKTRAFFNSPEKTELNFITTKIHGEDLTIAQVGNSPNAYFRAKYLALLQPQILEIILKEHLAAYKKGESNNAAT